MVDLGGSSKGIDLLGAFFHSRGLPTASRGKVWMWRLDSPSLIQVLWWRIPWTLAYFFIETRGNERRIKPINFRIE